MRIMISGAQQRRQRRSTAWEASRTRGCGGRLNLTITTTTQATSSLSTNSHKAAAATAALAATVATAAGVLMAAASNCREMISYYSSMPHHRPQAFDDRKKPFLRGVVAAKLLIA